MEEQKRCFRPGETTVLRIDKGKVTVSRVNVKHEVVISPKRRGSQLEGSSPTPLRPEPGNNNIVVDPHKLPNLKHTKVLSAFIDGDQMPKQQLRWRYIRNKLIHIAIQQGKDIGWLSSQSSVKFIKGNKAPYYYQYLPDCNISVSGTDAESTGQISVNIALELSIPVKLKLEWRKNKKDSAYPGETAVFQVDKGKVTLDGKICYTR